MNSLSLFVRGWNYIPGKGYRLFDACVLMCFMF